MADAKKTKNEVKVGEETIDLTDKVTLIAPKGAKHHKEGEKVQVHPVLQKKFESLGFKTAEGEE